MVAEMKMWKSCGYVCFHPYPCGWMCYVDARDVEHSELLVHRRHVPGDDHDTDDDDDMHIVTIMLKYYCSVYNLHFLTSM